ncbi:competence protein ComEA [Nocardia kruczakiae]|uniref:Competence protein ComEA n=1 Tax=Nocardia kruczakiae TaxID=261477 RepID=A0ABU1XD70_9NOCA|nr:helix-hairpin-helix domain-containing protein [Nocardia kruczakiae]MDR7168490.1 competence protein ComEA [Nocardia kruczakiae]
MARHEDRTLLRQRLHDVSPGTATLGTLAPGPGDPTHDGLWDLARSPADSTEQRRDSSGSPAGRRNFGMRGSEPGPPTEPVSGPDGGRTVVTPRPGLDAGLDEAAGALAGDHGGRWPRRPYSPSRIRQRRDDAESHPASAGALDRGDRDGRDGDEGPAAKGAAGTFPEAPESPRIPQWLSEPVGSVTIWQRLVPERFRGVRVDPGRKGVWVLAGAGVAAVILAAAAAHRDDPVAAPVAPLPAVRTEAAETSVVPAAVDGPGLAVRSDPPGRATPSPAPGGDLVVSVIGLVEHPGLLHLAPGTRVADAVAVAVAREGADLAGLNLAQRLADGDQIVVGEPGPASGPRLGSMVVAGASHTAATSGAASPPGHKVNLNTATEQDLDSLTGVGPTTAAAIIGWRNRHGRFTSIDQLAEVTGIGPAKLNRLRDQVTL